MSITTLTARSTAIFLRKFNKNLPREIAGLAAWYDSSDAITLSVDASGNVSQWNDKSGNGRNLTQATTLNRPGFTAGDGLTFTSAGHQLTNATSLNFSSGATIFIAYKPTDITGYTTVGGGDTLFEIGGYSPGTGSDGTAWGTYRLRKNGVTDRFFSPPGVERIALNHRILQTYANATESFCKIIGTNTTSNTLGSLSGGSGSTISVGPLGASRAITIREIIAYDNGSMASGDRQKVEDYLAAKWTT